MTELSCPRCQAPLRSYERSGVTVDRCTRCGGVFLDRGELERMIGAETGFNRQHGWSRSDERDDDDRRPSHRRRHRGFPGELFGDD